MKPEDDVVADETVEPKERTIREEIEAARDEINARGSSDDRSEPVRPVVENAGGGEGDTRQVQAGGRQRGPDGKFTRADADGGREEQPSAGTQQTTQQPGQQSDGSTQHGSVQPVALPAPQSWSAEEKKLWAQVPAAAQQIVTRREQEAHRRITEQDEVRTIGNQFMSTANEFAPIIQSRGGNPVALFREFLGIIHQIQNSDPANRGALFRQLAMQNGADLRAMGQPTGPGTPNAQGQQQPNVPIDQLVQRAVNEQFQARQRQEQEAREQAEIETTNREIEAFRSKVDANGQPAYPYFGHVTSLMASILGGGAASTLEEAYQLAVKAHPETSALIEQSNQAAARAAEEKRLKAQAARRKAGSIPPGVGNSPQANGAGNRSIRDELKAAFEESRGRV